MFKMKPKTTPEATSVVNVHAVPEITKMVHDGQRLLVYIARNGHIDLDPELSAKLIEAKYKLENNDWGPDIENQFLMHYDRLAKLVYPVTVDSINAVIPKRVGERKQRTKAEKAVVTYRRYTMFALILLIVMQAYWLFGSELRTNLQKIFDEREQTRLALQQSSEQGNERDKLSYQFNVVNQKLDANYNLLLIWNSIWSFGSSVQLHLQQNFNVNHDLTDPQFLQDNEVGHGQGSLDATQQSQYELRIIFFENVLSADFVLTAFQSYILPLLYGLLGAVIYVLRELLKEVKELTYNFDSEIRFRLRITLGALGGMVIGFFLKGDNAAGLASLSPMAIAFLMGYNVEVLFSLMDKFIDNVKGAIDKPTPKQTAVTKSEVK